MNDWTLFKALCARDFVVLRKTAISDLFDAGILVFLQWVNYAYFLPVLGMDKALIIPLFVSGIGSFLINSLFDRGIDDAADISFAGYIRYQMTIPVSLNLLFIQKMCMHAVALAVLSVPSIIMLLAHAWSGLTFVGLLLFVLMYLLSLIFVTAAILLAAYSLPFFWFVDNLWTRVLLPMLFLGCQYFSWKSVYNLSPWVGFLYALSPLTYINEGMRSALLGSEQFLPVSLCACVLCILIIGTSIVALKIFRKRLYA